VPRLPYSRVFYSAGLGIPRPDRLGRPGSGSSSSLDWRTPTFEAEPAKLRRSAHNEFAYFPDIDRPPAITGDAPSFAIAEADRKPQRKRRAECC